jgi:metal-responsive CopG/Arc/MetJ family transcriptional regulator
MIVMAKDMMDRYRTVNLPIDMVDEVDRLIDVFSEHGYTSRADFIKQAVREKILELEALETQRYEANKTRVFK